MHVLAGLDRPTAGWVQIDGTRLDQLSDHELTLLRRRAIGFVFQS
jgi:putative ABC transport system ATP-binding protein